MDFVLCVLSVTLLGIIHAGCVGLGLCTGSWVAGFIPRFKPRVACVVCLSAGLSFLPSRAPSISIPIYNGFIRRKKFPLFD